MTSSSYDPAHSIALAVQAATLAAAERRPPQEVLQLHYNLVETLGYAFGWQMARREVYSLLIVFSELAKPTPDADLRAEPASSGWFDADTLAGMTTSLGVNVMMTLAGLARGTA